MNPRAEAQHRARLRRHEAEQKALFVLIPLAAVATACSFAFDWSWWIRGALAFFTLTLLGDLAAVRWRLKDQRSKLTP